MLIRFNVENYKSFERKQSIDMLSVKAKIYNEHIMKVGKGELGLLPLTLIYGANASGKSNLVDAIAFGKSIILGSQIDKHKNDYCRVSKINKNKNTTVNFEFCIEDKYYSYGFSVNLFSNKVISEWLYEIKINKTPPKNSKTIIIYERIIKNNNSTMTFNEKLFNKSEMIKLKGYDEDFGSSKDILFLSEINRNKKIDLNSSLGVFSKVYNWFSMNLLIVRPNMPLTMPDYLFVNDHNERITNILKNFDTGISGYENKTLSLDEFERVLLAKMPEKDVMSILNITINKKRHFKGLIKCNAGIFSIKKDENIKIKTMLLRHNSNDGLYNFNEESDGTQRLFDLMSLFFDDSNDKTYIFDEVERSLHPLLTYTLIKSYLSSLKDRKMQFISTTHESTIMDQNLIRRDEVWFTERDHKGVSKIFPLREFKERYDKSLDIAYRAGRYGAIPILHNVEV